MNEILIKKPTYQVMVGSVPVGGGSPIVVQSMTNTDTADVEKTVEQVFELWKAGSEIVRVTVNNEASADAIPRIVEALKKEIVMCRS
jgi:(E)-4-hydroxy-3-methylbut-2-enyl-diphosphate synthase